MKAKAVHWVRYSGVWHEPGSVFEMDERDLEAMKGSAEACETPQPPAAETEVTKAPKRGRKAK